MLNRLLDTRACADKRARKDGKAPKVDAKSKTKGPFEAAGAATRDTSSPDTAFGGAIDVAHSLHPSSKAPEKHRFHLGRFFGLVCQ